MLPSFLPSKVMDSYRNILINKLTERKKKNAHYSLRAFARDLTIDHSQLSLILRGKQGLSIDRAEKIVEIFQFNLIEKEDFLNKVLAEDARSKTTRANAMEKIKENKDISFSKSELQTDVFSLIADWENYALLELTRTIDFKSDPNWIAARLGITKSKTTETINRLMRLGLLIKKNGVYVDANKTLTTSCDTPSVPIRYFNRQILNKAIVALDHQPVDHRDFSTLTMAFPIEKMTMIKEKIKEFRRSLNSLVEESLTEQPANSVYCLSVQLFELTHPLEENDYDKDMPVNKSSPIH